MNDFDYDVLQKKRTASGARHVKKGSRSKKCTLPSDLLTAKQRKELNGTVETYNLGAAMKWKEFKEMPLDLQAQYIENLQARFDVRQWMVSRMFGVSEVAMANHFRRNGIKWESHMRKKADPDSVRAFEQFSGLNLSAKGKSGDAPAKAKEADVEETVVEKPEVKEVPKEAKAEIRKGCITLSGNPADIASKMVSWLGVSKDYTITIDFEVVA